MKTEARLGSRAPGTGRWTAGGRRTRVALAALVLASTAGLLSFQATSGEGGVLEVEGARTALEQWVETRRVMSKEQHDWDLGREMLDERIALVRREVESLQNTIGETQTNIAEADRKRADLVAENDKLVQGSAALAGAVQTLETRTTALLTRLPDPIRDLVKPLSQRFPDDPKDTKLSLSERFQNVIGVLNAINKFNRDITLTSEIRSLGDGTTDEVAVTALYVGIGHGYYTSADGRAAGIGTASASGWVWTPANDAAREIATAIAILRNEQVASYVPLPVRID